VRTNPITLRVILEEFLGDLKTVSILGIYFYTQKNLCVDKGIRKMPEDILAILADIVSNLGPTVFIPIVFTLVGIVLGMGLLKSLRAGLAFGIGLVGIFAVLDIFLGALDPISSALVETVGSRSKQSTWVGSIGKDRDTYGGGCLYNSLLACCLTFCCCSLAQSMAAS